MCVLVRGYVLLEIVRLKCESIELIPKSKVKNAMLCILHTLYYMNVLGARQVYILGNGESKSM